MKRLLPGLILATAAGFLAARAGLPLPWMLAPFLTTAALSLAGVGPRPPVWMRQGGQMMAALAVGTAFSPEVIQGLMQMSALVVACAAASILAGAGVGLAMARLSPVAFNTTFFAALPGGVAEMSVLAERHGGDTPLVAMAQSMRIVVVVLTLPVGLFLLGQAGTDPVAIGQGLPLDWARLALMVAAAWLLGTAFARLRVMNAYFLAGFTLGILAAAGPVPLSSVPGPILALAQILLGTALGARLDPSSLRRLRHFLPLTVAGTLVLLVLNVALALAISRTTGLDAQILILATAPGGVAEMSITAQEMSLDVAQVTAFHLVRILLIVLVSAPLYRLFIRFAKP